MANESLSRPKVIVCGAGIGGLVAAYWLGRGGVDVTVVERASSIRTSGLGIDIKGPGIEVIRRMGIEEEIQEHTTKEEGVQFVDSNNNVIASFGVDSASGGPSLTAEIEIMRYDLCQIFFRATQKFENVKSRFGLFVESLAQEERGATVTFSDGSSEFFDIVVAADGLFSKTRDLVLTDAEKSKLFRSFDLYVSYFTIPRQPQDGSSARWFSIPGRRGLLLRPKTENSTASFATIITKTDVVQKVLKESVEKQKEVVAGLFADVGWEAERIMSEMKHSEDFYLQFVAQVKLDKWSKGSCVYLGDAAYSPSPITGLGTTSAIVGAYILAMEINKARDGNYQAALEAYEEKLRPFMREAQRTIPGTPNLVNPETAWGVWFLGRVLWFVSWSGIARLFGSTTGKLDKWKLPDYDTWDKWAAGKE